MLGGGHPEVVFGLHRGLGGDIFAADRLVRRQPGYRVAIAFSAVHGAVGCPEVQQIVGQLGSLLGRDLLGAGLPGVRQGHGVVDLDGGAGVLTAPKLNAGAGERVVEDAGPNLAGNAVGVLDAGQVSVEHIVSLVAPAAVDIGSGQVEMSWDGARVVVMTILLIGFQVFLFRYFLARAR